MIKQQTLLYSQQLSKAKLLSLTLHQKDFQVLFLRLETQISSYENGF
jgi:hypothetical protein